MSTLETQHRHKTQMYTCITLVQLNNMGPEQPDSLNSACGQFGVREPRHRYRDVFFSC